MTLIETIRKLRLQQAQGRDGRELVAAEVQADTLNPELVCLLGKRFSILSGPLSVAKTKISASVPHVCLTAVPTKRLWNNWAYLHKQKVVAKVGVVPNERLRQVLPQRPTAVASAREGLTANKHTFCSLVLLFYSLFFSLVSPRGAVPCGFVMLVEGRLPSLFYPGAVPR